MKIFGEHHQEFLVFLDRENAKRLQVIDTIILLVVFMQTVIYSLSDKSYYDMDLIRVKVLILLIGIVAIIFLQCIRKELSFAVRHSQIILFFVAFFMILLSILNTFYAQEITNDISIYLLVLMAVMAANRRDVKSTALIIGLNYFIFAFGMRYFQTNPSYLFSHLFNGALTNILAFLIASMFYQYSIKDFRDKLEIDQKNKRLKELSEKDDLTGLYNKRTLYLRLEEMIQKSRDDKSSIFLGILDLDHFKEVNDKYGHLFGDEVLKEVAEKIQHNVREDDIAGRYGGDEFVIIFHDISHSVVTQVMTRILEEVNKLEFGTIRLSFSCGVAVWNGESCEKLFERADEYMYDVKRFGKNDIKIEPIWAVNR